MTDDEPPEPRTAAATRAVRRRGEETMAAKLRDAGWFVVPPERVADLPPHVQQSEKP